MKEITKELLENLYIKQRKSKEELKSLLSIGIKRLNKLLEEYNLSRELELCHKTKDITKEQLEELYIKQNLTRKEVCKILNISKPTMTRLCREFNVIKSSKDIVDHKKNTMLTRYGVEHTSKLKSNRDKMKLTSLKLYGTDNYAKTSECKQIISQKVRKAYSTGLPQDKCFQTKLKNDTLTSNGISKPELVILELLLEKFPHTQHQYKDSRYPSKCDFYIPELDLFIEYQGKQYHYKEPYDPNNIEHLKRLNYLEEKLELKGKRSKYEDMINTWTQRDPLKREIARKNGLNFKELWNLKEAIEFIMKL